jgi:hypothetical protein
VVDERRMVSVPHHTNPLAFVVARRTKRHASEMQLWASTRQIRHRRFVSELA